jgi:hypothetical protein
MLKFLMTVMGLAVVLSGSASSAHGQRATEMYIPVGQSPGLSGKHTVVGKIKTINAQDRTLTIVGSAGTHTATITGRTKIWLDRSKLRLANQKGTFSDCQEGQTVEIKYEDPKQMGRGAAEWVKVQPT